ncbi:MAG: hypothetical protein J5532_01355 [Lachnospiraceae bacterium]|nr:hypothetical protein [Lachnospiraceae bacterium]
MFLSDSEVDLIIAHKTGRIPEDDVYRDMKQYFADQYKINLLDYICSAEKIRPVDRKRVSFIVWDAKSVYKYRWDFLGSEMEADVKKTFAEVCRKHDCNPDFFDPGNFFMFVTDFESDALARLIDRNRRKIEAVLREYPQIKMQREGREVWYIFFETEADRDEYAQNGLLDEIRRRVKEAVGVLEGFEDQSFEILWTSSLETFNGKYHGSWRAFLD